MSCTLQKLTKLLLVFILAATPLRASFADGEVAVGEFMLPHDLHAQAQLNNSGNPGCCCIGDDCFMQGCDQCNFFTPVLLALTVQLLRTRHRLGTTPYLKEFDSRQLGPTLQPPRA